MCNLINIHTYIHTGSCTSRPIKGLARPPRTPWEEAPARSPNPESAAIKRAMVRFRGAREKGAMIFVERLGFSQEDTMEGPLWRETLRRSLGSHDATEPVSGMCHGNVCRQATTRLHAISCTKTG